MFPFFSSVSVLSFLSVSIRNGIRITNVVPVPSLLSKEMVPPIFSTSFFCDWHSQPCSGEFCAASCMFLCKWFKNAFLECLCHSDPGISADKFQCGHCCLFRWDFPTADIDISVFFVIFHRIGQNIHQGPFHMHRTSNKIPVCNFFFLPTGSGYSALWPSVRSHPVFPQKYCSD